MDAEHDFMKVPTTLAKYYVTSKVPVSKEGTDYLEDGEADEEACSCLED